MECKEYRETDHPIPGRWQLGEWRFDRCPKQYLTESVECWITSYSMFKNGFLPNSGGWLQQSNKFVAVMAFIDAEVTRHNQKVAVNNGRK